MEHEGTAILGTCTRLNSFVLCFQLMHYVFFLLLHFLQSGRFRQNDGRIRVCLASCAGPHSVSPVDIQLPSRARSAYKLLASHRRGRNVEQTCPWFGLENRVTFVLSAPVVATDRFVRDSLCNVARLPVLQYNLHSYSIFKWFALAVFVGLLSPCRCASTLLLNAPRESPC